MPQRLRWLDCWQVGRSVLRATGPSVVWTIVVLIGIAVVFPVWFVFGIASILMGVSPPVYFLVTVPVIAVWLILIASVVSQRAKPRVTRIEPPTPWRLCDPQFSHWGVWRAELGRFPAAIDGFRKRKEVERSIRMLLFDWNGKSARGVAVVRISKADSPAMSPIGDDPKGCMVYQITLVDDFERRTTGWMRFGDGCVEFQLCRAPGDVVAAQLLSHTPAKRHAVSSLPDGPLSDLDPLWDRWLDG
jgi:hypothetical protein